MCGIAGQLLFDRGAVVSPDLVRRMCGTLVHRGPDEEGAYVAGPIGLGIRRLSIIDPAGSHQPVSNEDGSVRAVLNGEIYNYVELRAMLAQRGHRFRTAGDTETIVHLYEDHGDAFVSFLRGMFAVALWDARGQRLVLVRDRIGKKPLYYAPDPGRSVTFGSELKALIACPGLDRAVDPEALDAYLSTLYIPAPRTIFKAVRKLPAAHMLVCAGGRMDLHQYWDVPYAAPAAGSAADHADQLHERLRDAVAIRLRSDVPLAAFLSGGLDSSAVVSTMTELSAKPVVACSVGFDDPGCDELAWARRAAAAFRCEHHAAIVEPDLHELLPRVVRAFDEPFADPSAVPTFILSTVARRHATVALSGDGGDELLAGYWRHTSDAVERRLRGALGAAGLAALPRTAAGFVPARVRGGVERLAMAPDLAYAWKHCGLHFDPALKASLYSDGFASACAGADASAVFRETYQRCPSADPVDKALYVDLKTSLADGILVKVDRMSMASSLEVRSPLLDHHLVEFCAGLPRRRKLAGGRGKRLLARAMAGSVPDAIRARAKQGFSMPLASWLRTSLRELACDALLGARATSRGLFVPAAVHALWTEHQAGRADHGQRLWALLMLELWHREYVDHGGAGLR